MDTRAFVDSATVCRPAGWGIVTFLRLAGAPGEEGRMRSSRLVISLTALVGLGMCGSRAALAADAVQAEAPPGAAAAPAAQNTPEDNGGLAEVLVTARFKSESLQTAPIAITAVTGDQLEARGFVNITQVAS